ncbi:hypothetical protein BJ970_001937 [Saccharopolyspora phatthalungensis]|uniref:Uncharacterized protein n=1 Tax=Saccharopolyspora phatthalungensis TaxID=664693 RepID=A0A840QC03_9PSEU|nr:hypothetical protein [Saccharopolyspora phatthalungensis]
MTANIGRAAAHRGPDPSGANRCDASVRRSMTVTRGVEREQRRPVDLGDRQVPPRGFLGGADLGSHQRGVERRRGISRTPRMCSCVVRISGTVCQCSPSPTNLGHAACSNGPSGKTCRGGCPPAWDLRGLFPPPAAGGRSARGLGGFQALHLGHESAVPARRARRHRRASSGRPFRSRCTGRGGPKDPERKRRPTAGFRRHCQRGERLTAVSSITCTNTQRIDDGGVSRSDRAPGASRSVQASATELDRRTASRSGVEQVLGRLVRGRLGVSIPTRKANSVVFSPVLRSGGRRSPRNSASVTPRPYSVELRESRRQPDH